MSKTFEEISGALARGYCSKMNENKILDPELIASMAVQIQNLCQDQESRIKELEADAEKRDFVHQCDISSSDSIISEMEMKIKELEEKLAKAKKCLREYADPNGDYYIEKWVKVAGQDVGYTKTIIAISKLACETLKELEK